jgi:hypothetical protein
MAPGFTKPPAVKAGCKMTQASTATGFLQRPLYPPGNISHKKKPRLSVGAAMKRMEKLLLDSKKHL